MYDDVELEPLWIEDDLLALIKYIPGSRNPAYKLVLDFKQNQPHALKKVRSLAIETLRGYQGLEKFCRGYLVSLPSHSAGSINEPCEYLCAELAKAYPRQLVHLKQALRRSTAVRKSATAPHGLRPTYDSHLASIQYIYRKQIDSNERIIMVDDVFTRGATSSACRDILMRDTGCTDVLGLFVARTMHS